MQQDIMEGAGHSPDLVEFISDLEEFRSSAEVPEVYSDLPRRLEDEYK
jgi:hypothetical protein